MAAELVDIKAELELLRAEIRRLREDVKAENAQVLSAYGSEAAELERVCAEAAATEKDSNEFLTSFRTEYAEKQAAYDAAEAVAEKGKEFELKANEVKSIAFALPLIFEYYADEDVLVQAFESKDLATVERVVALAPNSAVRSEEKALAVYRAFAGVVANPCHGPRQEASLRLAIIADQVVDHIVLQPNAACWDYKNASYNWETNMHSGLVWSWPLLGPRPLQYSRLPACRSAKWLDIYDQHNEQYYRVELEAPRVALLRRCIKPVHRELLARFRQHRGRAAWLSAPVK